MIEYIPLIVIGLHPGDCKFWNARLILQQIEA